MDSRSSGTTLTPMSRAMSMEQMGSAIIRSYFCIRSAEMMTPILPRVSAMMWRRTPCRICLLEPLPGV